MSGIGDRIVVLDGARVTPARARGEIPDRMVCPQGHPAEKYIIKKRPTDTPIPCYVCQPCQVVYRYHECSKAMAEVVEFNKKDRQQ